MVDQRPAVQDGIMFVSMPSLGVIIALDQPASGSRRTPWRPLITGLLVDRSTVSIRVALAAALFGGVPAEVLLGSF